jgi:hypothetical protein
MLIFEIESPMPLTEKVIGDMNDELDIGLSLGSLINYNCDPSPSKVE